MVKIERCINVPLDKWPNFSRRKSDWSTDAVNQTWSDSSRAKSIGVTSRLSYDECIKERYSTIKYFEELIFNMASEGKCTSYLQGLMRSVTMDYLNLTSAKNIKAGDIQKILKRTYKNIYT